MNGEKSPRVMTPIWQRFKLPKLPSPKSPRPKLPPKPQSLSSRSSDTEGSKPSSPGGESGSSAPSSPDTNPKRAPTSPRFFSWGSKREKKGRPPSGRPTASPPPPPPPQVSSEQVGESTGGQVGVKGEPDQSVSVSRVTAAGEDNSVAYSVSDSVTVSTGPSVQPVSIPNLTVVSPSSATPALTSTPRSTDSDVSQESYRSLSASATSGDESSDAAQRHSPRSAVCKPPLPPHLQRPSPQVFHKARLQSARRQYFSQERQVSAPEKPSPPRDVPPVHVPSAPTTPEMSRVSAVSRYKSGFDASKSLKERFEQFSSSARAERERLAKSTPDLSVIEASVRRQRPRIDSWSKQQQQQQQGEAGSAAWSSDGEAAGPHRGAPTPRAAVHERYKSRAQRIYARSRSQSAGVLETDLDTGTSRELLSPRETDIDDLYRDLQHLLDTLPSVTASSSSQTSDKTRAKSLLDLDARGAVMATQLATPARPPDTRAKSMEFLLDDGNKAAVQVSVIGLRSH
ncbi:hypothetical protein Pcinc_041226 [Petrolisthes cinctipes]|nr:hypothetical protein Pcinc_041226 [Petrolisthes cinctipes]